MIKQKSKSIGVLSELSALVVKNMILTTKAHRARSFTKVFLITII